VRTFFPGSIDAAVADEDLHRHAAENIARADALLFGLGDVRNDGGSVAGARADGSEA
jgi:hypothetical protein